jgi:hypothetical protein
MYRETGEMGEGRGVVRSGTGYAVESETKL